MYGGAWSEDKASTGLTDSVKAIQDMVQSIFAASKCSNSWVAGHDHKVVPQPDMILQHAEHFALQAHRLSEC